MSSLPLIHLTKAPLDPGLAWQLVQDDGCGAVNLFVGSVRQVTEGRPVTQLKFEAYEPMAVREMEKIAQRARERWPVVNMAIHHRLGTLAIGEIAVIIAAATPHRKASFDACRFAIDTLKQTVPIWKKEFFKDGSIWVAAHP